MQLRMNHDGAGLYKNDWMRKKEEGTARLALDSLIRLTSFLVQHKIYWT